MAMEDPHLMRLGHYLEHLEGPEEVARLLNDGIDLDELEKTAHQKSNKIDNLSLKNDTLPNNGCSYVYFDEKPYEKFLKYQPTLTKLILSH